MPGPKKSDLPMRILSALVMLPVAIYIILSGGMVYFIFLALLGGVILYEWNGICEDKAISVLFLLQLCGLFHFLQNYPELKIQSIGLSVLLVGFVSLFLKKRPLWAMAGYLYALIPSLSLLWLWGRGGQGGWIILWMMVIVWSMDTGAYFAGKKIGGPKMSPRISPNKTWAGLIGGAICATVLGVVFARLAGLPWGMEEVVLFSAVLAIWSQIGDLAESAVKRHFKVKDSGNIIPGHGGVMDRVDGVVFAAPAVALFVYVQYGP